MGHELVTSGPTLLRIDFSSRRKVDSFHFTPPGHAVRMREFHGQLIDARARIRETEPLVHDPEAVKAMIHTGRVRRGNPPSSNTPSPEVIAYADALIGVRIADVLVDGEYDRAARHLERLAVPYFPSPPKDKWAKISVSDDIRVPDVRVPFDTKELSEIVAAMHGRDWILRIAMGDGEGHDTARSYLNESVAFPHVAGTLGAITLADRTGSVRALFRSARAADEILSSLPTSERK